jgi:hypothetical protein
MDFFGTSPSIMFVVLCELIATVWLYGMDKFSNNVEMMTGHRPNLYWSITCRYIAPLILLVLYVFSFFQFNPDEFSSFGDRKTVIRVSIAGWIMSTISTLPIPVYAIWWFLFRREKIIKKTTKTTTIVEETIPMEVPDEP